MVKVALFQVILTHALRCRCAKLGEGVQDDGSCSDLGSLPVEVDSHEALAQELDAVHLGLDQETAVILAPPLPKGASQMLDSPQSVVAVDGPWRVRRPGPGIFAWHDDSIRAPDCDSIPAFLGVTGSIGCDGGDALGLWNLA